MSDRIRYVEAAIIALADAARTQDGFDPGLQLQRAQVLATLASAEQARIANLIAYKALRQSATTATLPTSGDAVTDEIEAVLGLLDPPPTDEARDLRASIRVALDEAPRRTPHAYEYLSGEVQAILDGTQHGQASA